MGGHVGLYRLDRPDILESMFNRLIWTIHEEIDENRKLAETEFDQHIDCAI